MMQRERDLRCVVGATRGKNKVANMKYRKELLRNHDLNISVNEIQLRIIFFSSLNNFLFFTENEKEWRAKLEFAALGKVHRLQTSSNQKFKE